MTERYEYELEGVSYDDFIGNALICYDKLSDLRCRNKEYNIGKTYLAEMNQYRCIHIFDWDDRQKILNTLKPKKSVYARNCSIYKLNKQITDAFLNEFHLQGTCKGQVLSLGLVSGDELLQVMTFGKPRYNAGYDVELLRLATKSEYIVVGGASKLFKFATNYYELDNIISYCDRAKFTGKVYENLHMKKVRINPPQIIWSNGTRKITSNLLRRHGFDQLFGTDYGKGANNGELMFIHGWIPIYDCGQVVYEYRSKK